MHIVISLPDATSYAKWMNAAENTNINSSIRFFHRTSLQLDLYENESWLHETIILADDSA